jgi:2-octaprenyl-6-methoxyphenol hydroxylase
MDDYDVCIIGSGFCGSLLANSLSFLGIKILVLEKRAKKDFLKPDDRNLVLSYGSGLILKNLGYSFKKSYNLEKIEYSLKGVFGSIIVDSKKYSVPFLGKVVNAGCWLKSSLYKDCLYESNIENLELSVGNSKVEFTNNGEKRSIKAKIVIGADGYNSVVRSSLGGEVKNVINGYVSYIVHVSNIKYDFAWIRSDKNMSLAYVPNDKNNGKLILTTKSEVRVESIEKICKKIAGHRLFEASLNIDNLSKHSFSIATSNIKNKNGICIGNALHSLPPVAAQGFNLGVRDCALLVQLLSLALIKKDISISTLVERFYKDREKDIKDTYDLSMRALFAGDNISSFKFFTSIFFSFLNNGLDGVLQDKIYNLLGLVKPYNVFLEKDIHTFKKEIKNAG